MVPNLSRPGFSFKGAFDYHRHDKGTLDTAERVEWSATRRLMTDDLDRAEKVMIATAYDADRLKQEAGVKATGRKSNKHVQTFSLAWSPDEHVDREEMERAADAALKQLGLDDHQAIIVAHNDTRHQHVHVIVNRVNPNDGRLATLSNGKRKLDRWAHDYEKSRDRIVTPNRAEKFERQEKARQAHPDKERRAYVERRREERRREASHVRSPRASLAQRQQALKDLHRHQWDELKERHRQERAADYQNFRTRLAKVKDEHNHHALERKTQWRDFYAEKRDAERQRKRMERRPTGALALAVVAAREERRQGAQESYATLTWANLVNRDRREAVFASAVERDRAALAARQTATRDAKYARIRSDRSEEIEARRGQQAEEKGRLKEKQMAERDRTTIEWRQLNAEERLRRDEDQRQRREDEDRRRRDDRERRHEDDRRRQDAIDRGRDDRQAALGREDRADAFTPRDQERLDREEEAARRQREERSEARSPGRDPGAPEMHLRPDQPRDLKPLPEIYSDRDAEIDGPGPAARRDERKRREAMEELENGAYGRDDTRVEELMEEYGLEDPSDLQSLDAERFEAFEARREAIARDDIESRDRGAEDRYHFGERSEADKAQERLQSIRESREKVGQNDERSAADRLAEMRQSGRDREAEERSKRSRERDNDLGL